MSEVRLERLTSERLRTHLDGLARLRIEVFRAFPYLYEGSTVYEERYLKAYAENDGSVIVGAFDGPDLIGAATGMPLSHEMDSLQRPFVEKGYDPAKVFYFGESVLRDRYRGRGIGVAFFREREAHARSLDGFTRAAFCAVIRPPDHPRRPDGYQPLDAFWRRRGYAPVEGLIGHIAWRDLDEEEETEKPMQFWMKAL